MSALGKIAHDAFYESFGRSYTSYDDLDEGLQRGWDAAADAIANRAIAATRLHDAGDEDPGDPEPSNRYALVEQMGHRATYAAVREITFCGEPMLEVTDLATRSMHVVSPKSLYEVSWLTEEVARSRAKPWTATAITAGDADSDPWPGDEDDQDAEPAGAEL